MHKSIVISALALFSSLALANTPELREQRSFEEHQTAVSAYAERIGKPMPEIEDFRYGMKIDVARYVRQSRDPRNCEIYPRLMTYEDSAGTLRTLRYRVLAQCTNNN